MGHPRRVVLSSHNLHRHHQKHCSETEIERASLSLLQFLQLFCFFGGGVWYMNHLKYASESLLRGKTEIIRKENTHTVQSVEVENNNPLCGETL